MDLKVLEKYGVTLANALDPASLVKLRTQYVALVGELDKSKESVETEQESLLKVNKETAEKNEEIVYVSSEFAAQVRAILDEILSWNPETSFLLVDVLQSIKNETMLERDYQLGKVKRNSKSKAEVSSDFEEKKEEASVLADAIRSIFTMVREALPKPKKLGEGLAISIGDGFLPVKKSEAENKKGELMPDLPKLPRTPGDSGGNVGRGAKVRRLRFSWAKIVDGVIGEAEFLPVGTIVTDVAHDYVSDRKQGIVPGFKDIQELIESTGQKMFGDVPWVINFPTGQLTGWLPTEAE